MNSNKQEKERKVMNKVILSGRLTAEPEVRYSSGENPAAVAKYHLAVDRRYKKGGESAADFIRCVAFGSNAEFTEKYLHKGMKMVITGRIQTGSYTNREGQKVYTTDVIVEGQEFAEKKSAGSGNKRIEGKAMGNEEENQEFLTEEEELSFH